MKHETSQSIAQKLLDYSLDEHMRDDTPHIDSCTNVEMRPALTAYVKLNEEQAVFYLFDNYKTESGVPALKKWRISVELVEDSTADD
jgi:hypothetical protein